MGFGDLADDAVSTKQTESASDGLRSESLGSKAVEGAGQVAIAEAVDSKLAIGQYLAQQSILVRPGSNGAVVLALASYRRADFATSLANGVLPVVEARASR